MELSRERIQEMKNFLEKEHRREFSWEEASDAAYNMIRLAEVLLDAALDHQRRQKKLEESPKGFHLEGNGYICFICGQSASKEQSWYDKYGIKCMICQAAIDRKEIPASLAKNKESWYSKYEIESTFNVKSPTVRRWVKEGVLKARTVTYNGKGIRVQLFLIKDNKDTLPPKDMVKSQMVKETKEGKDWFHLEPWYRFIDPFEHLKDYKIMNYLRMENETMTVKASSS